MRSPRSRRRSPRVKKAWLAEWSKHLDSDETPINQYRVIRDLMRTVDRDNVIITHDSGSPREQLLPFWETTAAGSYMGWGKSTQLGYGLGLIMGAKLAAPDKLCVNVMGDSAIGMTGMDIETASRNKIAILTVVFNNGVMAAERDVLKTSTKKYGAMTVGGNYAKVAEGLNVASTRVEKPADIVPAIKDAVGVTRIRRAVPARDRRQGRLRLLALSARGVVAGSLYSAATGCACASGSRWRSLGATSRMNSSIERASFAGVAYGRPAWNIRVPKPPTWS